MKELKKVQRNGAYISVLFDGEERWTSFETICGGLSWPFAASPGYFCLLGQYSEKNTKAKKPVFLLDELEADLSEDFFYNLPDSLYKRLAASAGRLFCQKFYPDLWTKDNQDFYASFEEFQRKESLAKIRLENPPVTNWGTGLQIVRQWENDGSLSIPKDSVIGSELGKIIFPDDHVDARRPSFPAVSALCNVIGAFAKPKTQSVGPVSPGNFFYS